MRIDLAMDKDAILLKLRDHAPDLKKAGVLHLRIFGSVAKGSADVHSDVDLIADFDASKRFTLLTISRIHSQLEELLCVKVDLTSADWMKEHVRRQAMSEATLAF